MYTNFLFSFRLISITAVSVRELILFIWIYFKNDCNGKNYFNKYQIFLSFYGKKGAGKDTVYDDRIQPPRYEFGNEENKSLKF